MSDYTELRQKSLAFRRLSSNLLNSTYNNADVNLARFAKFIDEDDFLHQLIHSRIDTIDYDFKNCFRFDDGSWGDVDIPIDEDTHLKAQYDLLQYILKEANVLSVASRYLYESMKINDHIQHFLSMAFKPMIDLITDSISTEMINIESDSYTHGFARPNINNFNGNLIMNPKDSTVNANITFSAERKSLATLIDKLLPELDNVDGVPEETIKDVKDDLESLREQVLSESPKPNRVKKALGGIKSFGNDVLVKLAVNLAGNAMLNADWPLLIQQAEQYLSTFIS